MVHSETDMPALASMMRQKPETFLKAIGSKPYQKQIDIANALVKSRRVSVVGCNGSGKDWLAARLALWFATAYYPAKVIITGPTFRQVDDVIFNELRTAYRQSPINEGLGGRLFDSPRWELDSETFIVGFSTDRPWNLQGFHSPNLLTIVTEAHAMDEDSINALYRLNPNRILMVGNPFASSGPFYASHHQNRHLWDTFQISAFDTPNLNGGKAAGMISEQDVHARAEEWGVDSVMYRGAILGEFSDSLDDVIVPLSAAINSSKRKAKAEGEVIVACDVARYGKDKTVAFKRQGNVAEIIYQVQGRDLMEIAGWLGRYCDDNPVDVLVIDDTGLGGGVTDRVRETIGAKTKIEAFTAGSSAIAKDRFSNSTTEAWWNMREWIMGDGQIPDDPALIGQLTSRKYNIQSDKRLQLESKDKMSKSPDEADALSMTFIATAGWGVW